MNRRDEAWWSRAPGVPRGRLAVCPDPGGIDRPVHDRAVEGDRSAGPRRSRPATAFTSSSGARPGTPGRRPRQGPSPSHRHRVLPDEQRRWRCRMPISDGRHAKVGGDISRTGGQPIWRPRRRRRGRGAQLGAAGQAERETGMSGVDMSEIDQPVMMCRDDRAVARRSVPLDGVVVVGTGRAGAELGPAHDDDDRHVRRRICGVQAVEKQRTGAGRRACRACPAASSVKSRHQGRRAVDEEDGGSISVHRGSNVRRPTTGAAARWRSSARAQELRVPLYGRRSWAYRCGVDERRWLAQPTRSSASPPSWSVEHEDSDDRLHPLDVGDADDGRGDGGAHDEHVLDLSPGETIRCDGRLHRRCRRRGRDSGRQLRSQKPCVNVRDRPVGHSGVPRYRRRPGRRATKISPVALAPERPRRRHRPAPRRRTTGRGRRPYPARWRRAADRPTVASW